MTKTLTQSMSCKNCKFRLFFYCFLSSVLQVGVSGSLWFSKVPVTKLTEYRFISSNDYTVDANNIKISRKKNRLVFFKE
jgi:hypothetical protein